MITEASSAHVAPRHPHSLPHRPLRIVVVGAGIGGLAAAIGLQAIGSVTVIERAQQIAPVGAGLSLFGNGCAALAALGLEDHLQLITGPAPPPLLAGQRSPSGRWLATLPPDAVAQLRVVHRADLQRLLLNALPPGTVLLGTRATKITAAGAVHLHSFGNQGTETSPTVTDADLIIAADGIHSRLRSGFPAAPAVRYAGWTAWRGITDRPIDLQGAMGETWGRGRRFGIAPLPDGRIYWYATVTTPPDTSPVRSSAEHAALTALFKGWHDPIPQLLAATHPDAIIRSPICDLDRPLPSFVNNRTVLLGDAAHAMTPDLGQGANQALEDAATLANLLQHSPKDTILETLPATLKTYDRLRRPRTQRVAARSRRVGRLAQANSRAGVALRDLILQLTPAPLLAHSAGSVQTWQPPSQCHPASPFPASTATGADPDCANCLVG
jgi:2-polyprenyl-6-methoxyphenol hydroxylase-like FAD-dependent oxidoreductase